VAIASGGFLHRAHKHRSEVTRYFYRITGHLQDAEDLVTETYARLLRVQGMDHLSCSALRSYVMRTARNVAFDWREKRNRSPVQFTSDPPIDQLITREETPEQHALGGELAERIEAELARLSPARRRVFELSRFEGLKVEAIAQQLGTELSTVKKHLAMALAQLRKVLSGQGESHE
jgi:RNA polymerase sigma factor (sigma-70 family)